jgi:hypothetical protein
MGSSANYDSGQEDQTDVLGKRRRQSRIDAAINWGLVSVIALVGFWIIETDIDLYQHERLFFKLLSDGVTAADHPESLETQEGLLRNSHFKGQSGTAFFIAKWKLRAPSYFICVLVPLGIAFFRGIRKQRNRWNWAYYFFSALSLIYMVYYWGHYMTYW